MAHLRTDCIRINRVHPINTNYCIAENPQ